MSDFVAQHHDAIRSMVRAVGSRLCRDRGWDIDDLTSDVMVAVVTKQRSPYSRFTPERGPLTHYLRMITRSVVSSWLSQAQSQSETTMPILEREAVSDDVRVDERGVDDEQLSRLTLVLQDANRVLVGRCDTAYRVLVAWLSSDDVDSLALMAGLSRLDVLRYLAKHLSRLERRALPRWRGVWQRHRSRVYRQIDAERRTPAPLKRVEARA